MKLAAHLFDSMQSWENLATQETQTCLKSGTDMTADWPKPPLTSVDPQSGQVCYGPFRKTIETMPRPAKPKQKPPHAFVLEALMPLNPEVRRMFSGFALYLGDRIVCILREHPQSLRDNGV
ncbi:MAG: hypothetical protein ABR923_11915 [Terracidiphilus sp.]